jgi:uncharacterized membrane protein
MATETPFPHLPGPRGELPEVAGPTLGARLKRYFFTGLVIAGPVAITLLVTFWLVSLVDGWVKPLIPAAYLPEAYLPFALPGFGLLVAIFMLTLIGFLAANFVGRTLVQIGETIMNRTPVIRGLYGSTKQVFETLFSKSGTSFRKVGLVEYPAPGMWSIVLISSEPSGPVKSGLKKGDENIGVFLPCSPNPTTGFFFYLPRSKVIEIDISTEEAARLVMSAGLVQPPTQGSITPPATS